ncbi:hypothetical protein N9413_02265 [Paracoccaceae bacterium]|nr:hypothetical protein [Paracoccaceae bacterium]
MGFKSRYISAQTGQLQRRGTAHGKANTINPFRVNMRRKIWISQHRIKRGTDVLRPLPHAEAAAR